MSTLNQPSAAASLRRFATFELDLRTGELRKGGIRLRLQQQPFQILAMLLERPGQLVTREELRQKLWPSDTFVDFDHGLNTAINKLRDVLNDPANAPRYIETLPRRGYRFIYPIEGGGSTSAVISDSSTAQPSSITEDKGAEFPKPPRAVPRILFMLLQLLYLVIYVATLAKLARAEETAAWKFGQRNRDSVVGQRCARDRRASVSAERNRVRLSGGRNALPARVLGHLRARCAVGALSIPARP
jgi:DNA-binding winged helix-turn-helix (wHTH) protein